MENGHNEVFRNSIKGCVIMLKTKKYHIWAIIGILVVLALLITPLASRAMTNMWSNTIATKEPIDPYVDQIKAYQDELQRKDLSTDTRNLTEEKLKTISMMATQRADGKTRQPTRQVVMQPTPSIEVSGFKLPDGIDNHPSIPFSEAIVTVLNSWRKTTVDRYYLVYAGFLTQDIQQGAILVLQPKTYNFKQYNLPKNSGGVSVVEEKGTILILQSNKDALYYFDVNKEQFVDSKGTPIPTSIPTERSPAPTSTSISPYP